MKITLPILFNTDSTSMLEQSGVDFDLRECDVKEITFYQISGITDYVENGIEYSQIYSNRTSFYSTLKKSEVEMMIDKQLNPKFAVN